jgi:cardiolipin synthase
MSRRLMRGSVGARFLSGNNITLLQNGEAYFPALEAAIHSAHSHVWLETYIFADDAIGRRIRDALAAAASRGAQVRVVVDGFGSNRLKPGWWQPLLDAGGEVRVFRPEHNVWSFKRKRLRRLHRKLAVVDRQVAFVSGINIQDDWDIPGQSAPRFDFAVKLKGPLVQRIEVAMGKFWLRVDGGSAMPELEEAAPKEPERQGPARVALLLRDNLRHRRDIERAYLSAIGHARQEILIANAYFLPGRRFRRALRAATQRGVRVTLMLQGMVEYRLQQAATRALYGPLLDAGVRIFEYQPSYLHAKVAVIDNYWATVGSSNIDPFSLLLAREANVAIEDESFASELKQRLERVLAQDCLLIESATWHRQPWHVRLRCWLSYGIVRYVLGAVAIPRRW